MAQYINEKGLDLVLSRISEKINTLYKKVTSPITKWVGTEEEFSLITTPLKQNSVYVIVNEDGLLTDVIATGFEGNISGKLSNLTDEEKRDLVTYVCVNPESDTTSYPVELDSDGNFTLYIDPRLCGERAIDMDYNRMTLDNMPTIESVTRMGDSVTKLPGYIENGNYTNSIKYPELYPNVKKSMPPSLFKSTYVTGDTSYGDSVSISNVVYLDPSEKDLWSIDKMVYMSNNTGHSIDVAPLAKFHDIESMKDSLRYCKSITNLNMLDTSKVKSMSGMFYYYKGESLDVSSLNISSLVDASNMFSYSKMKTLKLPNFEGNKIKDASKMFNNCSSLEDPLDLTNLVTSNMTNIYNIVNLVTVPIIGLDTWDTSNVTGAINMPLSITTCDDIKNWNVGKVTGLYINNSQLSEIDLKDWDTSNLTILQICDNSQLSEIDLKDWDLNKVTMLYLNNNSNVVTIDLGSSHFELKKLLANDCIFSNNANLKIVKNLENISFAEGITCLNGMFFGCSSLEEIDISGLDLNNKMLNDFFKSCSSLNIIKFPKKVILGNDSVLTSMFSNCSSLSELDLSGFYCTNDDTLSCSNMFYKCGSLEKLYIPNLITNNIPSADMLCECKALNYVKCCRKFKELCTPDPNLSLAMKIGGDGVWDIVDEIYEDPENPSIGTIEYIAYPQYGQYNNTISQSTYYKLPDGNYKGVITDKVDVDFTKNYGIKEFIKYPNTSDRVSTAYMFSESTITNIDLSKLDLANVYNMQNMFYDCFYLKNIELNRVDTSKVVNMNSLFMYCESLDSFNANIFDFTNILKISQMFCECVNLQEVNLSNLNVKNINNKQLIATDLFDNCNSLNTIACRRDFYNFCQENASTIALPARFKIDYTDENPGNWIIVDDFENNTYLTKLATSLKLVAPNNILKSDTSVNYKYIVEHTIHNSALNEDYIIQDIYEDTQEITVNDTESDRIITITKEFEGLTASIEVTLMATDSYIHVDLNDNWLLSLDQPNPDGLQYMGVYESFSNYNVNNGIADMYIRVLGITSLDVYIRSYAERNYDYTIAYEVDVDGTNDGKTNTKSKQNSNTDINAYTKVSYTIPDDGNEHFIKIRYKKDSSTNQYADKGYVLIGYPQS